MSEYVGVNGIARKITKKYVGVNGVGRKITKEYVGVSGVARKIFGVSTGEFIKNTVIGTSNAITVNDVSVNIDYPTKTITLTVDVNNRTTSISSGYVSFVTFGIMDNSLSGKVLTCDLKVTNIGTVPYCDLYFNQSTGSQDVSSTKIMQNRTLNVTLDSRTIYPYFYMTNCASGQHTVKCVIKNLKINGVSVFDIY